MSCDGILPVSQSVCSFEHNCVIDRGRQVLVSRNGCTKVYQKRATKHFVVWNFWLSSFLSHPRPYSAKGERVQTKALRELSNDRTLQLVI
jgi:hypothetical protein